MLCGMQKQRTDQARVALFLSHSRTNCCACGNDLLAADHAAASGHGKARSQTGDGIPHLPAIVIIGQRVAGLPGEMHVAACGGNISRAEQCIRETEMQGRIEAEYA